MKRAKSFDFNLKRDPTKIEHFIEFMGKMIRNSHAEIAPSLTTREKHWYLPIFSVYYPPKPESVRVVFDSSAKCNNQSLNDGLHKQFIRHTFARKRKLSFYNFHVKEHHRKFWRFIWHKSFDKPLIHYRTTGHFFGNTAFLAIANYGLRKAVENADHEVRDFVENHFHVDYG